MTVWADSRARLGPGLAFRRCGKEKFTQRNFHLNLGRTSRPLISGDLILFPCESSDKLLTHRPLFGSIGQASEPGVLRIDSGENASQIALLPLRDWFASGCVCPEDDEEARQIRDYGEGWPGRHGCCVYGPRSLDR